MIAIELGDYVECEDKHGCRYIGIVLQIRPSSGDAKVLIEKIVKKGAIGRAPFYSNFITKRSEMAAEILGGDPEQYAGRICSLPDLNGRQTEWIIRKVESEVHKPSSVNVIEGDGLFSLMRQEAREKNRKEDESRPANSPWGWL